MFIKSKEKGQGVVAYILVLVLVAVVVIVIWGAIATADKSMFDSSNEWLTLGIKGDEIVELMWFQATPPLEEEGPCFIGFYQGDPVDVICKTYD